MPGKKLQKNVVVMATGAPSTEPEKHRHAHGGEGKPARGQNAQ